MKPPFWAAFSFRASEGSRFLFIFFSLGGGGGEVGVERLEVRREEKVSREAREVRGRSENVRSKKRGKKNPPLALRSASPPSASPPKVRSSLRRGWLLLGDLGLLERVVELWRRRERAEGKRGKSREEREGFQILYSPLGQRHLTFLQSLSLFLSLFSRRRSLSSPGGSTANNGPWPFLLVALPGIARSGFFSEGGEREEEREEKRGFVPAKENFFFARSFLTLFTLSLSLFLLFRSFSFCSFSRSSGIQYCTL